MRKLYILAALVIGLLVPQVASAGCTGVGTAANPVYDGASQYGKIIGMNSAGVIANCTSTNSNWYNFNYSAQQFYGGAWHEISTDMDTTLSNYEPWAMYKNTVANVSYPSDCINTTTNDTSNPYIYGGSFPITKSPCTSPSSTVGHSKAIFVQCSSLNSGATQFRGHFTLNNVDTGSTSVFYSHAFTIPAAC